MAVIELRTLICGKPAGTLWQDEAGLPHFRYDEDYRGIPLSLAMPLSNRPYNQQVIRPYLFGLLPDSEFQRRAIADEFEIRPNNPVTMLSCIGLDCPGGVQFCPANRVEEVLRRPTHYEPVDDHAIALRLKSLRTDEDASWLGEDERWSLGGNQGKFALAWHDGRWCSAHGAAPTTHIFKNGVIGFKLQALNEYACMKIAERAGVATAEVNYRFFEDEPALIVKRYDRIFLEDGTAMRIHQEDCCQALGYMPDQKYAADGGPGARDLVRLFARTNRADFNVASFTYMLFFNYLIGGTDAHAKNYSLMLAEGGSAIIAPMYDVASGLAYDSIRRKGRLAMGIGGENRFGRVGSGALKRYAEAAQQAGAQISYETCLTFMTDLAQEIPVSLAVVFDEMSAAGMPGTGELRERVEGPITENCRQTLALL